MYRIEFVHLSSSLPGTLDSSNKDGMYWWHLWRYVIDDILLLDCIVKNRFVGFFTSKCFINTSLELIHLTLPRKKILPCNSCFPISLKIIYKLLLHSGIMLFPFCTMLFQHSNITALSKGNHYWTFWHSHVSLRLCSHTAYDDIADLRSPPEPLFSLSSFLESLAQFYCVFFNCSQYPVAI